MSTFIRKDMLPAMPPPTHESGAVRWLRENLFSTALNTLLTVVGLTIVAMLILTTFPWLRHSVWSATSLRECRAMVADMGATEGACWAVIRHWWKVYIFGFFPSGLYWRPLLTFGLLFAALAPVLFWNDRKGAWLIGVVGVLVLLSMVGLGTDGTRLIICAAILAGLFGLAWVRPRLLLWVTVIYPFAAIWLLWGGQVWEPLSAILAVVVGIAVGLLYGRLRSTSLITLYALFTAIGAAIITATLLHYTRSISADFLTKMSGAQFYPGFLADSGYIAQAFGAVISSVLWAISMVAWALIAVLRWVSFVLDLNLSRVIDFPFAGYFGIGAILAGIGTFKAARSRAAGIGIFGGLAAIGVYWVLAHPVIVAQLTAIKSLGLIAVGSDQFGGFLLAIVIGVSAIAASLPMGILLALGRRSDMFLVRILSIGFIEFIRGVPLITLLFTASLLLAYFLPPGTNFDLVLRVIILVTLFSAAYIAEVVRGGLAALPRGQYEAADALGLDYWQAQRLIIMPQALKISIPGIVSTFIGLFKDTTLVSFVGLLDPLRGVTAIVRADINWKGIYWEPYIFVGILFFILCFSMSRYSMYLERKLKTDHR
ncbi:MAG: amino acid ABC transporter permease [Paracoccaceae bacterium]